MGNGYSIAYFGASYSQFTFFYHLVLLLIGSLAYLSISLSFCN